MIYSTIASFSTATLLVLSCNLLSTVHAQLVTPAPSADDYLAAVKRDNFRRQSLLDGLACFTIAPGCTQQLTLFDACQAQYSSGPKNLYCLCTTGYYSAVTECDKCSVSVGAMASSDLSSEIDLYSMECAEWYSSFGTPNESESKTTSVSPALTEATARATPKGAARSSASPTEPTFSPAAATATTATTPTEPFGGLVGEPTTAAASPAKTSKSAASSSRVTEGIVLPVLLAIGGFLGIGMVN